MAPDHKTKSRKTQNWFKFKIPVGAFHWPQVKLALHQVQEALPKDLGIALFQSVTTESKDVWKEFYQHDIREIGKAAKGGKLSLKGFFAGQLGALNPMQFRPSKLKTLSDDVKSPLFHFIEQINIDLAKCQSPQEKATYVLKVSTLFASGILSISTALNVATIGLAKSKLGGRPWIPSLGVVLGASIAARLLDHAVHHIPADSKDRQFADFLKANFEIFAFGGSLGILEIPDFVEAPGTDPSLKVVQQLISELMGYKKEPPKLIP